MGYCRCMQSHIVRLFSVSLDSLKSIVHSAVPSFFHIGLTYSWGIVQARLSASHLAKDSTLSFIGSTAVAFVSFAALVNARIIRRLGTRNSALLGCFSLGFGKILNGWASYSIAGLFVTNGVIVGFGTSLCFMVCITLLSSAKLSHRVRSQYSIS